MSRKTPSFGQLLGYLDAAPGVGPWLHNLRSQAQDVERIEQEFLSNARWLPPRRNGNVLFHEILSFSPEDSEYLPAAVLEDLTRHYLELRAPYALAYGRAHVDTDHLHVHLMISANNIGSSRRLRLSKSAFRSIQREMERYQKERFPDLRHSLAQETVIASDRNPSRLRTTRAEQERFRRGETRPTRKQQIRDAINAALTVAISERDCTDQLGLRGLRLYRRGKSVGVEVTETGRRHRLKTLGLRDVFDQARRHWLRQRERQSQVDTERSRAPARSLSTLSPTTHETLR